LAKLLATERGYLFTLATLGDATENRNYPIFVALANVVKPSSHVSLVLLLLG
jgi:hypothetical protein